VDPESGFPEATPEEGFHSLPEPTSELEGESEFTEDLQNQFATEIPAYEAVTESENPFAEVSEFGNSDTTQSAFSYTVFITGIDSAGVRSSLQDALSDAKFGWVVASLMAQIKDGALTIRSVSAVKASILIQRIKYLPVKISWRQDVLSSSV
jgi:hypothetical protein